MKKRELSPIELKKVVELRQLGAKWTEIEWETKVERRVARRAYEEWERDQKMREQEAWRFRVIAEAFHEHLNDLVRLAESLTDALQVPKTLRELRISEEDLGRLWIRYLEAKHEPFPGSSIEKERAIRRSRMLLESLQSHTREKIRWEALEEWKESRNNAIQYLQEMRSKAIEIIRNNLNNYRGLEKRIKTATKDKDVIEKMADGVIDNIWRGILTGKPDQIHAVKGGAVLNEGQVWLQFYERDEETKIYLNDVELAKEVRDMCREVVTNLEEGAKSDLVHRLTDEVSKMQARAKELEQDLDELVLRPTILRTRCKLCPA